MKSRIMLTVLVIALAAALIAGATAAWFTDTEELPEAEFTAGTLDINVDKGDPFIKTLEGRYFDNVNPGDCASVFWNFENVGTKRAELRIKINGEWGEWVGEGDNKQWVTYNPEDDGRLPDDYDGRAAFFAPKGDWVMYEHNDGMYLYYKHTLQGTYNENTEGTTAQLRLVVGFDGPNMDNRYQGKKFRITGEVQAVQATNGAPEAVWGIDSLQAIKDGVGAYEEEYFQEGERGAEMECWKGGGDNGDNQGKHAVEVNIIGGGNVTGEGDFEEGDQVTLTAIPGEKYFVGWEDYEDLPDYEISEDGLTLTFTMPDRDVQVTAVFEERRVEKIVISGPNSIKEGKEEWYEAKAYDQRGNEIPIDSVEWSLAQNTRITENSKAKITNTEALRCKVRAKDDDGSFTLYAKYGTIIGNKTIYLYD